MTREEAYKIALEIMDKKTQIFCVCGSLATGLHTSRCQKFKKELEKLTKKIMES